MNIPHKHKELITAWANGAKIQRWSPNTNTWDDQNSPNWLATLKYRIKPEPDVIKYCYAYEDDCEIMTAKQYEVVNLKLTFDGETKKLKSAEVV